MGAIALGSIGRVLAQAHPHLLVFLSRENIRAVISTFMSPVAEWLAVGQSAGAKCVVFASFQLHFLGGTTCDFGKITHSVFSTWKGNLSRDL